MKLSELIERLQDIQEGLPEGLDPVVLLAEQPRWAFEYSIGGLGYSEESNRVYIGEGTQLDYFHTDDEELFDAVFFGM